MDALLEWGVFVKLGLAGLGMVRNLTNYMNVTEQITLEWWLYEIMQVIAGLLGTLVSRLLNLLCSLGNRLRKWMRKL